MFAADDAAHGKDAAEKLIEDAVHPGVVGLSAGRSHEIDVDIAVPGVAEAGDGNPMFFLEAGGQAEKVENPAPGDRDILIQLHQAGVAQGVAEAAADLPKLLTSFASGGKSQAGASWAQKAGS